MIEKGYLDRIKQGGVLIYLRKSRESDDTEDTLENHRFVLENLCKKNGLPYEIKEEIGSSDTIEYREVFNEIYEKDIPSGLYSAIIVNDQSRLSRNTGDFARIKESLVRHDVLVVDRDEKVYDYADESTDFVSDINAAVYKRELQEIRKRLRNGKIAKAMQGKWVNGKPPYGYFYDRNTREIKPNTEGNPSPVQVVQSVFKYAYKDSMTTSDIAFKLNRKGIYTDKGNYWSSTAISRMLSQEVYLGKTIYGKSSGSGHLNKKTDPLKFKDRSDWIVIENAHESLVSEEIFEGVQEQINRRKKVIATRKSKTSILSGLVKCNECGAGMYVQRKANNKNIIRSCWKKDPFGNKCVNKGMAESKIIDKTLIEIKKYRDELAETLEQGQGTDHKREELQREIKDLEKQLNTMKAKFERLDDFLEDGIYSKEKYLSRKEKLTNKQKDIESEIELLQKQLKKLDSIEDRDKIRQLDLVLNNFKRVGTEGNKNKLLKAILSDIDLKRLSHDEEGEITVNFL